MYIPRTWTSRPSLQFLDAWGEWRRGNGRKRAFHKFCVIEMNRDWRDASRQEDEIEARVFQGHGYAWVGPELAWFTSRRSRETFVEYQPQLVWECSCSSVCAFSNYLSACLPDTTFHDVILFEDGSVLIL